jgi:hypothetical protein
MEPYKWLIDELNEIAKHNDGDIEANHSKADDLLLTAIGDKEVTQAYENIDKWYA